MKNIGLGIMLAVGVSAERARALIGADSNKIWIAAVNSPQSVTLGGGINNKKSVFIYFL